MIIRCYGARGSIPVSGDEFVKYGGDTACLEIRTKDDEIIIVDAGSGIRRLGNRLLEEKRRDLNLIFTHSHWDHILGFPFFKPLFQENTTVNLMGCPTAQGNIQQLLSKAMTGPFFPIHFENLNSTIHYSGTCPVIFQIGSVEVSHINLSHPNIGLGYKFQEDGKSFVFLTDNGLGYRHRGGCSFEDYVEFAKDADLLFHDAEYSPDEYTSTRTWGHSKYTDAMELAISARVKKVGLFHHHQDRTDPEQDKIVEDCREIIASRNSAIECVALTQTSEFVC